jgi:AcrR family transcriptional regulator
VVTEQTLRSDAAANRQRLIDAAAAVFAERGTDAEMKEIAERAGVGIGTIYRNFATKEDLVEALILKLVADVLPRLQAALAIEDPRACIEAVLGEAWTRAEQHGELMRRLLASEYRPKADDHPAALIHLLLEESLERGIQQGVFRSDVGADFVARYLMALFPAYLALRDFYPAAEVQPRLTRVILRGILAEGPEDALP